MPASPSSKQEGAVMLNREEQGVLLSRAQQSLEGYFYPDRVGVVNDSSPHINSSKLLAHRACFVTLYRQGELCGCTGTLAPDRSLLQTVADQVLCSALEDHRFTPLLPSQLPGLEIQISVLSPPEHIHVSGQAQLASKLATTKSGLILKEGRKRAIFLPQVWQHLSQPSDFISALLEKGGWPASYWSPEMSTEVFDVQCFSSHQEQAQG